MYEFDEIDATQLQEMRGGGIMLIDVRTDEEVAASGLIEGAAHVPLHQLPTRLAEFEPDAPTVLYCKSGARSAQGCAFLAQRGFVKLFNLRGGVLAWIRDGFTLDHPA